MGRAVRSLGFTQEACVDVVSYPVTAADNMAQQPAQAQVQDSAEGTGTGSGAAGAPTEDPPVGLLKFTFHLVLSDDEPGIPLGSLIFNRPPGEKARLGRLEFTKFEDVPLDDSSKNDSSSSKITRRQKIGLLALAHFQLLNFLPCQQAAATALKNAAGNFNLQHRQVAPPPNVQLQHATTLLKTRLHRLQNFVIRACFNLDADPSTNGNGDVVDNIGGQTNPSTTAALRVILDMSVHVAKELEDNVLKVHNVRRLFFEQLSDGDALFLSSCRHCPASCSRRAKDIHAALVQQDPSFAAYGLNGTGTGGTGTGKSTAIATDYATATSATNNTSSSPVLNGEDKDLSAGPNCRQRVKLNYLTFLVDRKLRTNEECGLGEELLYEQTRHYLLGQPSMLDDYCFRRCVPRSVWRVEMTNMISGDINSVLLTLPPVQVGLEVQNANAGMSLENSDNGSPRVSGGEMSPPAANEDNESENEVSGFR